MTRTHPQGWFNLHKTNAANEELAIGLKNGQSVLAAKRKESRFEVIVFSEKLHDLLIDLMQRNFGIKDVDDFVRSRYAHGKIDTEDFAFYRWQLAERKKNIDQYASRLTSNLRDAYSRFPQNMHEYEVRRDLQNNAIGRMRPITSLAIPDRTVRHVLCDDILLPEIRKHIIYDNCASLKGRGIAMQRKRFEIHLQKFYRQYGSDGYILFGDFSKFYDNILHEKAKDTLLKLFDYDEFLDWLLMLIFQGFEIDVSYMTDEEYEHCLETLFNKIDYRKIPKSKLTGEKIMKKSIDIGDQLAQAIGIYYPTPVDTYVKYVRSIKFYGRYSDDWYAMSPCKEELLDLYEGIKEVATPLGMHINEKKTRIVKMTDTYKYLQIKYTITKDGKLVRHLNQNAIRGMRQKLKKLAVMVQDGERTYESVEQVFRSWMGSQYKFMSNTARENMIKLFEDLFNKEVKIVNKKMIITDRSSQDILQGGNTNGTMVTSDTHSC